MKSLREFSSAVMQKHLLRAKLRQLVNKARVYGRTPDNVGEIKKGWGQYDAMKARAFAAQVFALRELASRSARVVELARGDRALNWIRNTKLVNPAGKVETMADTVASAPAADRHAFYKSIVHATRNPQDTLNRKIIADIMRGSRRELAARSARVVELARGDYAIPALRKIQNLRGGIAPLDLLRGNTVNALKGNRYPALDGWNGYLGGGEIRKRAADKIRGVRKDQMAAELADAPFFKRHPGMKISTAIERLS
jgi:hypothetical protein